MLETRAQLKEESFIVYIGGVLWLCRMVDPDMDEADMVSNLLKGVLECAFRVLLTKVRFGRLPKLRHATAQAPYSTATMDFR